METDRLSLAILLKQRKHAIMWVYFQIATDPVLAYQKGRELWASLSKDEPENQARPENVEQLIVLLTRESARRVVHLINYTSTVVSKVPRHVSHSVSSMIRKILNVADSMVKVRRSDYSLNGFYNRYFFKEVGKRKTNVGKLH